MVGASGLGGRPERRCTGGCRLDQLGGLIDILLTGEAPKAQANRAPRRPGIVAQGQEHMGGSVASGIAGRGRGERYRSAQRLGIELAFVEGQAQGVGNTLARTAIEPQARDASELLQQALAQPRDDPGLLGKMFGRQCKGSAHARDLMSRQGAGA